MVHSSCGKAATSKDHNRKERISEMKKNAIAMHSSVAASGNLVTNLRIAKEVGFDCVELTVIPMIKPYLEAGHSLEELAELTKEFDIVGIGWLPDIERQGEDFEELMKEAREMFEIAHAIGAGGIECLTGPADVNAVRHFKNHEPYEGYQGLLGLHAEEQMELLKKNVTALADLAMEYGLCLYLEPLGWTPVNKISQAYEIARTCGRDNVKCVIDTWHAYVAGDTPEEIADMDKNYIYGVHVSDSLEAKEGTVPDENIIRNCALGEGVVDYKRYCNAVKATGYDGWWNAELFSRRQMQMDPEEVARSVHTELTRLAKG